MPNNPTIQKKIFAYNFTSKQNLLALLESYNNKFNNDRTNLKERGLVYPSLIDNYEYVLDIVKKEPLFPIDIKNSGKITCCFKCILYKLRDKDLPVILNLSTGKKEGIKLDLKDTLVEQTHFIIFPELNLILSEYNHSGARIEKLLPLLDYILSIPYGSLEITPILRPENYNKIMQAESLKAVTFKTGHLGLKTISENTGVTLFDDLNEIFDELSDLQIEVIISGNGKKPLNPKDKKNLLEKLCSLSKSLITKKNNKNLSSNDVHKLKTRICDENKKLIPIDLLEDKLVFEVDVIKLNERYKYINSNDMFNKILNIYRDNLLQIDRHIPIM